MKKLSILDSAFLMIEKRETPMHVGGLNLFSLPDGADEQTFLHTLAESLRTADELQPPFGQRLNTGRLGVLGPMYWQRDDSLDLDYHIRHSALPRPGRYRELFSLVSRLHGTLLDRNRPLWEMHLIEGLQNRQFAIYSKYHHAAIDGVKSVHLTQSMMSTNPDDRIHQSPLSMAAMERYRASLALPRPPTEQEIRNVADFLKATYDSSVHLTTALKRFASVWTGSGGALAMPWHDVPHTSLNTTVDGARRFVAQSWPFARIHAVGKALDGTFNDAVLAMCAGALRIYLQSRNELPAQSLKAMVPISLRREGDIDSSNAVGAISADLATHIADPIKRFMTIQASTRAGKEMYKDMSPQEASLFMQMTQMPGLLLMPLGLIARFPPFSTVISNVPGPRKTMYWNGARLEGVYPASIVTEGIAMNITLVTCGDQVDFGIIACRRTMPQVQRLIDDMETALVELEEAAGLASSKKKPKAKSASGAAAKAKAKSKAKAKAKPKAKTKAKTSAAPKTRAKSTQTRVKSRAKAKAKAKAKATSKARPKTKAATRASGTSRPRTGPAAKKRQSVRPKSVAK